MKIIEITKALDELAPLALQEAYDNAGFTIGNVNNKLAGILCTVDVTEEVINEAIKLGDNLIVSHHPVIFTGIKSLTGKNYTERIIVQAIKNDLALYASHTNIDNMLDGVNHKICEKLGLKNCRVLSPLEGKLAKLVTFVPDEYAEKVRTAIFEGGAGTIGNYDSCSYNTSGQGTFRGGENTNPFIGEKGKMHFEKETRIETIVPQHLVPDVVKRLLESHPYEEVAYDIYPLQNEYNQGGAGMIGEFEKVLQKEEFLNLLKTTFHLPLIRYAGSTRSQFKKIAVCGGSGSFLINKAINADADAFITGDIKYHQFFEADDKIVICDIGHYESEQFTSEIFYRFLTKKFSKFAVHLSQVITNPIKYHF
ncbi:GTP cyclohydrolase 1 type 2 [subsurface metagenome]